MLSRDFIPTWLLVNLAVMAMWSKRHWGAAQNPNSVVVAVLLLLLLLELHFPAGEWVCKKQQPEQERLWCAGQATHHKLWPPKEGGLWVGHP